MAEPGSPATPVAETVARKFLAAAEGGASVNEAGTDRSYVQVRQSTQAVLLESCDRACNNLVLHRSLVLR